jgi:MFS family permease
MKCANIFAEVLDQLYWIILSYNLTSATFIPAWGQYANIFGRHAALQGALLVMLIGSVLCSVAPSYAFPMFLVGRALQGIGCAGLNILTKVILADKVSLKENAKNNSIFSLIGGLGYGFGPIIGGYLTSINWRYCFIINIPIAALGMLANFIILRPELLGPQGISSLDNTAGSQNPPTLKMRLSTIDFGGQVLFLFGMGMIIIALTWGGSYYSWTDVKVLAPLIIGALSFIGFLVWEYLMLPGKALSLKLPRQKAMVPFRLIWSRNSGLLFYLNFVTGMGMSHIADCSC